jgi:DNA-binding transcriptional ArsR family regulator
MIYSSSMTDESIVQVSRAIACHNRLRILSELACNREIAPTKLAARLHISLPMICTHLRRLTNVGLIKRRRAGAWSYAVAGGVHSAQAFPATVATWLFHLLRHPQRNLTPISDSLRSTTDASAEPKLHNLLFEVATAFTNARRLHLLRSLAQTGPVAATELEATLKMSRAALNRHGRKLARRGYLTVSCSSAGVHYGLAATSKTSVHAQYLALVRTEWKRQALRS